MNFFRKIFGKTNERKKAADRLPDAEINSIDDFSKLSVENRIIAIMKLGNGPTVNLNHFDIFKFAILSDPGINVKFAALKRIHFFQGHPDLIPMMNKLKEEEHYKSLEPYFSMALHRLGLISLQELEGDSKQMIFGSVWPRCFL